MRGESGGGGEGRPRVFPSHPASLCHHPALASSLLLRPCPTAFHSLPTDKRREFSSVARQSDISADVQELRCLHESRKHEWAGRRMQ